MTVELLESCEKEMEEVLQKYEQRNLYHQALEGYLDLEKKILPLIGSMNPEGVHNAYKILAECYLRQGNMYRSLGRQEDAEKCSRKEFECAQLSGNSISVAQSIFSKAVTKLSQREMAEGLGLLEEARKLFASGDTFDHIQGVGWYWIILADIGNAGITDESPKEIIQYSEHALEKLLPIKNWRGVSRAYLARSKAYQKLGEEKLAERDRQLASEYEFKKGE